MSWPRRDRHAKRRPFAQRLVEVHRWIGAPERSARDGIVIKPRTNRRERIPRRHDVHDEHLCLRCSLISRQRLRCARRLFHQRWPCVVRRIGLARRRDGIDDGLVLLWEGVVWPSAKGHASAALVCRRKPKHDDPGADDRCDGSPNARRTAHAGPFPQACAAVRSQGPRPPPPGGDRHSLHQHTFRSPAAPSSSSTRAARPRPRTNRCP